MELRMKSNGMLKQTEIGNIPRDWDICKVEEVAKINKMTITKTFPYDEIEYIDIDSVENGIIKNVQHIRLKGAPSRAKRIVRSNDIIISTVRPNLKHFALIEEAKRNTIVSTGFAVISAKKLNQQMNEKLESIGQALFKHWFIGFEFPNEKGKPYKSSGGKMVDSELGEIPEGWEIKEINDCGKVVCGKTPPTKDEDNYGSEIPFITIPDMRDNVFVVKTEKQLSKIGGDTQGKKELP